MTTPTRKSPWVGEKPKPLTTKDIAEGKKFRRQSLLRGRKRMKKYIEALADDIYQKYENDKHFPTSYDHPYENEITRAKVRKECLRFATRIYDVWGRMSK